MNNTALNVLGVLNLYIEQKLTGFALYIPYKLIGIYRKNLRFVASTKCKTALIETVLCITHADDQMLGIYRVIRQMVP